MSVGPLAFPSLALHVSHARPFEEDAFSLVDFKVNKKGLLVRGPARGKGSRKRKKKAEMKGNTRTNAEMPPESEAHPIAATAAAVSLRI